MANKIDCRKFYSFYFKLIPPSVTVSLELASSTIYLIITKNRQCRHPHDSERTKQINRRKVISANYQCNSYNKRSLAPEHRQTHLCKKRSSKRLETAQCAYILSASHALHLLSYLEKILIILSWAQALRFRLRRFLQLSVRYCRVRLEIILFAEIVT